MDPQKHLRVLAGAALACLMVGPAAAQIVEMEPGAEAPEHFGAANGTTTVPALAFFPSVDTDGFRYVAYEFPGGQSARGDTVFGLPNGSEITQLCAVVEDAAWCATVRLDLIGYEFPASAGAAPTQAVTLASVESDLGAEPGYTMICTTPPSPIRVRAVGNLDGDGDWGRTAYALDAYIGWTACGGSPLPGPEAGTGAGFGAAVIRWRRTVSPAPSTATFSDVPTSSGVFRFVEALAASGITGGCGGGQFCPNQAVTRGQMAVFLATALGLHWPN
jgi:hypothetical protein